MGLLSSSKSSANTSTSTETIDKRVVADGGSGVISADRSAFFDAAGGGVALNLSTGSGSSKSTSNTSVSVMQTDYGAIGGAFKFSESAVDQALQFAGKTVDAVAGQGFAALLDLADGLFERASAAQADAMGAVSAAYAQADADKAGSIDNRTLLILAAVAAVVVVGVWGKWK